MVPIVEATGQRGKRMGRWRGDKRENKRRLSQDEIAADAYLVVHWACIRTVIGTLPTSGRDLPVPRLTGYTSEGRIVALVPGRFISRMLQKKRGFSETETYFTMQRKLFEEEEAALTQVIWDPGDDVPPDRIESLNERLGGDLRLVRETDMRAIAKAFQEFSTGDRECLDNWLLESLRWASRYRG